MLLNCLCSLFLYDYHLFDRIFNIIITAEIAQLGERQTEELARVTFE